MSLSECAIQYFNKPSTQCDFRKKVLRYRRKALRLFAEFRVCPRLHEAGAKNSGVLIFESPASRLRTIVASICSAGSVSQIGHSTDVPQPHFWIISGLPTIWTQLREATGGRSESGVFREIAPHDFAPICRPQPWSSQNPADAGRDRPTWKSNRRPTR
jgi:hypothetical protein